MKESQAFPSNWLKAGEFTTATVYTVATVTTETVGQGENAEAKRVLSFKETDKELVLNKTNWKAIAKISGQDDDDQWTGTKVELFKTVVEFKGDHVDAIRVRPEGGWEGWSGPGKKAEGDSDSLPF